MLKEKLTLDEYNELGEFSVNQIDKFESGKIDIYFGGHNNTKCI